METILDLLCSSVVIALLVQVHESFLFMSLYALIVEVTTHGDHSVQ